LGDTKDIFVLHIFKTMNEKVNKARKKIANAQEITSKLLGSEMGKIAPNARDLEVAVLGAIMLDQAAVNAVIDILKPTSFYDPRHHLIFMSILDLFSKGEPIDILTVAQNMRKEGTLEAAGGAQYISMLTNQVASSANIETHARVISQKFIQRELIRISGKIIQDAYEETTDVFDLLDEAEASLFGVAEGNIRKNYDKMSQLIKLALDEIDKAQKNKSGVTGVPSGFTALDKVTNGWQRSDMIVIAARPAMGKTAFVLSMARNMAVDFKQPVAIFSLEMSSLQLVQRLISSETEIEADKLRRGQLAEHELHQLHQRISRITDAPLFIDDTPALSVFELRAKCRRMKAKHGIQMIIIDYLQLMSVGGGDSKGGNREQEISTISRSIKQIAKELDVPVIALSQLSRQVESRAGDKRPVLSDLRESGAIEQDADIVGFIYRPEYYGIMADANGNSTHGLAQILIAKHRNGAVTDVDLEFKGHLAKFTNRDHSYSPDYGRETIGANTSFEQGATTITMSSKLNNMMDDDEPFDYSGGSSNDPVPF